ncbi:MAG TPA: phosphotransferase [Actinocatenispora sp.]
MEVLQDEPHRRVVRIGDTVRRPTQPWTPTVHALLTHLRDVGFGYAPRPLGTDPEGREVLSYVSGECGPAGWAKVVDPAGLRAFARLLRDYHEAVAGFVPPPGASWVTGPHRDGDVVCHGDFGPWNVVWRGTEPVGLIDWDYAHPAPRRFDLGYALEYVAPFRDDAECLRWLRYPDPPDRRARIAAFCAAYGLDSADGMVDAVLDAQRAGATRVRELVRRGREPQVTWARNGHLAELDRRIAWAEQHRHLAE